MQYHALCLVKVCIPYSNLNQNKGSYIPEGLTPAQYEALQKSEKAKSEEKKKKFFKGKTTESLTEWMSNNEKKGLKGQELNRKGHKMVKTKYEGWYTNNDPLK